MSHACYVYAIVDKDTPLPAELVKVPWRGLAAVTGYVPNDTMAVSAEAVLQHEGVVETVRQHGPALPVRFGTVFRDATAVAAALAQRYEPLAADLQRLGAKVELSLTAIWATPRGDDVRAIDHVDAARAAHTAGAQYLLARAAELRREDALNEQARGVARELDTVLGWLAIERRVALLPKPGIAVRAAYLLDPADVSAFREAFEAIRGTRGELRVLLTGPWPPYSFVSPTQTVSDERCG